MAKKIYAMHINVFRERLMIYNRVNGRCVAIDDGDIQQFSEFSQFLYDSEWIISIY